MKPASFAPAYVALYPALAEIARGHGYALAVHGSVQRDFDVICIPWAEVVSPPDAVIADVLSQFAVETVGEPTAKLHGRVCYTVSIGFGECFADWSFMPVAREASLDATEGADQAAEMAALRADKARLDYLDRCNAVLNERLGTTYRWELILNHNVNRLMLGHLTVDLNDSAANGLPSCRDAIDKRMRETAKNAA